MPECKIAGSADYSETYSDLRSLPDGTVIVRIKDIDRLDRQFFLNRMGDWSICGTGAYRDEDSLAQHGPYLAQVPDDPHKKWR